MSGELATEDVGGATCPIRARRPLAEQVMALAWLQGETTAEYLDRVLKPTVQDQFASLPVEVRKLIRERFNKSEAQS